MLIYMAGVYASSYKTGGDDTKGAYAGLNDYEKSIINAVPNLLESYHYINRQSYVDMIRKDGCKVFIDSGAFSAHTLGVRLNINDYVEYLKRNSDIIKQDEGVYVASVLDGIGDPLATYRNQIIMEQLGFKPLPCFHYGEDERYLEHYIKNYNYITIGGMVGKSTKVLTQWLDRIFDKYLTDKSGHVRLKVHGFGITSMTIMTTYPWYSCDSSTWVQRTKFGEILTPDHGVLAVSETSASRFILGKHLCNVSNEEQKYLIEMLHNQGFDYDRLSKVYQSRSAYNLWAFGIINNKINKDNDTTFFQSKIQELF